MKNTLKIIVLLLLGGVFGVDPNEVTSVSVMEGDPVTLHTDTKLQTGDMIDWRFKKADSIKLLVQISENKAEYQSSVDVSLKSRLQVDIQTGDLTIRNMRMKYSGLYEVEINNPQTSYKRFNVTVKESPRVTDAGASDVKSVSVKEGDSVTLHTGLQTQRGDLILWRFGDESVLIAKGDMEDNEISVYDDDDGRFSGRLKLDKSGNLTITNIRTSNTGVYKLKISSNSRETKYKTFSVSVSEEGLSAVAKGFIVFFSLLVAAGAGVAGVLLYRSWMSQKLQKKLMDEMKTKEVIEGYYLLLASGVADMKTDDVIEWSFGETLIAEIKRNNDRISQKDDEIFGDDKLQLIKQSGDLKIKYISMKHAGLYKVKIVHNKVTSCFLFNVIVKARVLPTQLEDSVTIPTGLKQIKTHHEIEWKFKKSPENELLAKIHETSKVISQYSQKRFKDRLTVDPKTGSLIINKVTAVDTGVYILHDKTGKRQWNYYVALCVPGNNRKVILETGSELPVNTQVEWSFSNEVNSKDKRRLVTGKIKHSSKNEYAKGSFNGRLDMDKNTGNLTITIATFTDGGFYTLKLTNTSEEIPDRIFKVDFNELYTPLSDDKAVNEDPQESVKTVYDVVNVVEKDSARTYRNDPAVDIPLLEKV